MAEQDVRKGHHGALKPEQPKNLADWKPGSEGELAGQVYSEGDFGVHESKASRGERDYTSRNTKLADPGAAQPWSREHDGNRQSGAGGHDSGPGSSSGGDVDPDIIGVGTGGTGVSISGPSDRRGADETDGTSDQFASGGHAIGRVPPHANDFHGSTDTGGDRSTSNDTQGSDAATTGAPDDFRGDAYVGEVSSDEAAGGDSEPDRGQAEPSDA
jgi:hypothetical protein